MEIDCYLDLTGSGVNPETKVKDCFVTLPCTVVQYTVRLRNSPSVSEYGRTVPVFVLIEGSFY